MLDLHEKYLYVLKTRLFFDLCLTLLLEITNEHFA